MILWLQDLCTFFREKRLTFKILILLFVIVALFVSILMLITNSVLKYNLVT